MDTILLGKVEVVAALASRAATRGGDGPPELAPWLGLGLEGDGWRAAPELLERFPDWLAEAGLLASGAGRFLLYANPRPGLGSRLPSTFVLRIGAGRYSVQTWDCGLGSRVGIEIATAPPLVCSPPCSGDAVVALIESIRDRA